jgi:hypothetical protein
LHSNIILREDGFEILIMDEPHIDVRCFHS